MITNHPLRWQVISVCGNQIGPQKPHLELRPPEILNILNCFHLRRTLSGTTVLTVWTWPCRAERQRASPKPCRSVKRKRARSVLRWGPVRRKIDIVKHLNSKKGLREGFSKVWLSRICIKCAKLLLKKKLQIEGWSARLLQIQTKYFAAQSRTCSKMQGSAGVWGSKDPVDRKWIAIWWEPTRKLTSHDGSYIFSFILGGDVFLYLAHNVYFRAGGVDWVHRDLWKRVLWAALQKVRVKILVVLCPKTYKDIPISTTTNYMIK